MERIRSIEQLRMQKELLQLQKMIAELRLKKDVYELKRKAGIRNTLTSTLRGIVSAGIKTPIGKQILFTIGGKVASRLFKRKRKK